MIEERREQLRRLKAEVSDTLRSSLGGWESAWAHVLDSTDPRILEYVRAVVSDTDGHNLYELLAVPRFFRLLESYRWDIGKARHFLRFYEKLRFSGVRGRTRYRLTPVQVFQFSWIFGFRDSSGRRLTRYVILFVPRKYGKTTSVSGLAVYDLLFGDNNAEAYVGANSYDQAKICFDEIRSIMRDFDPAQRSIRINREKIFFHDGLRDSSITCLSSNAKTKDGLNASLAIMDEYAQARNTGTRRGADLKNVLTSSMGARSEPLTVVITTASDVVDGPFREELEGALSILRGEMTNDLLAAFVFMPDVDDAEDDPATWRKVQPHMGVTVKEDYYRNEWLNARLSSENALTFRTKLLNVFAVNESKAWITASQISDRSRHFTLDSFGSRPEAMCAIDLSERDDFSAVTIGIYVRKEKMFYFHTSYFFPEGAMEGHPNAPMYSIWAEKGYLVLTPGPVIDYRTIVNYILDANNHVRILQIGYDQWKSAECVNMLAASGAHNALKPVSQTYGNFTAPVESFEHGLFTGHVTLNDNPINGYCFGNAVLDEDRLENRKPVKKVQSMKIDGAITTLMCMRLFIDFTA